MEPVIVLSVIVALILDYFVSKEFYRIAALKGYPNRKYLWWTFFTGIFGCLMVVALPDRRGENREPQKSAERRSRPEPAEGREDISGKVFVSRSGDGSWRQIRVSAKEPLEAEIAYWSFPMEEPIFYDPETISITSSWNESGKKLRMIKDFPMGCTTKICRDPSTGAAYLDITGDEVFAGTYYQEQGE